MCVDGNKIDVGSTLNSISRKKGGRGAAVRVRGEVLGWREKFNKKYIFLTLMK